MNKLLLILLLASNTFINCCDVSNKRPKPNVTHIIGKICCKHSQEIGSVLTVTNPEKHNLMTIKSFHKKDASGAITICSTWYHLL